MQVVWRDATHADLPRIKELWDEQDRRFEGTGVPVDRPELFYPANETEHAFFPCKPPILHVRVAEKEGVIVGWRYTEAVCEVCIITGDEDTMKGLGNELTYEAHWAKSKGFRSGWGLVPSKFVDALRWFIRRHPHIRPWKSLTPVGINFQELGD